MKKQTHLEQLHSNVVLNEMPDVWSVNEALDIMKELTCKAILNDIGEITPSQPAMSGHEITDDYKRGFDEMRIRIGNIIKRGMK